jgi:hypothetical protein
MLNKIDYVPPLLNEPTGVPFALVKLSIFEHI